MHPVSPASPQSSYSVSRISLLENNNPYQAQKISTHFPQSAIQSSFEHYNVPSSHLPTSSASSSLPISPYGIPLPLALLQKVLSFLDLSSTQNFSSLDKQWYALIRGRAFVLRIPGFQGTHDRYFINYDLSRKDSEKILEQTGFEIPFPPGADTLHDYIIGRGSFGTLRIGYAAQKAHYVGIKITQGTDASEAEIRIQEELSDLPFVMPSLDAYQTLDAQGEKQFYQVMPLAGLGSAEKICPLLHDLDPVFREQLLFCIFEGFLNGLAALHERDIIHLDLKPSNLVIDHKGNPLLIDFGCSKHASQGLIHSSETMGDSTYFSWERWFHAFFPDVYNGKAIDAWAAGLTLLSFVHDVDVESLFPIEEIDDYLRKAVNRKDPIPQIIQGLIGFFTQQKATIQPIQSPAPDTLWAVINRLLNMNPESRPSIAEALQMPWFVKMRQESSKWQQETQDKLRELVQSLQREKRIQDIQGIKAPQAQDATAPKPAYAALSPQDLPHAHFANFIERKELQQLLQDKLLQKDTNPLAMTVCQGMGGVGKTQLVTYLLHSPHMKDHFGLRLWFQSADSSDLLEVQHLILARELRLVDEQAPTQEAIEKLHRYLASYQERTGKPWLAIYDNADHLARLQPYLPSHGGHVLITTRLEEADWGDIVPVDIFSPPEAEALLAKLLQRKDPDAPALCQELGYLPLGLVQAAAYMRSENLSVGGYLQKLRQAPQLLEQDSKLFGKKLPASMMSLWQVTLETLRTTSPDALALLQTISYLAPDAIPAPVLSKLGSSEALETIYKYALVQRGGSRGSSIHRLVQQVVRLQQSPEEKLVALQASLHALNQVYKRDPKTTSQRALNQQLLSHGEAVLFYAERDFLMPNLLKELFVQSLRWMGDLQRELGRPSAGKGLFEKALSLAEQIEGREGPDVAGILNDLGVAWRELGDVHQAKGCHERALAIFEKTYGKDHLSLAITLNNLGNVWMVLGDARQAKECLERAFFIDEKIYGKDHPSLALIFTNLGLALKDLGDARQAKEYFERAISIQEKTYGKDYPSLAITLNNLGLALKDLGDARQAKEYFERAFSLIEKAYDRDHPYLALILSNLGEIQRELGDVRQAKEYYEKAVLIQDKTYDKDHPSLAITLNSLGVAWRELGDARKAKKYLESALSIIEKAYDKDHPYLALVLSNLGETWKELGDVRQAKEYLERALSIYEKAYNKDHPSLVTILNNLGLAWRELGNARKAMEYLERALAIQEKVHDKDHPSLAITLGGLGTAWRELGNARKAMEYLERALAIQEKVHDKDHPNLAITLSSLGLTWQDLGDARQAKEYLGRALAIQEKAYDRDHPYLASTLSNLGLAWMELGNARQAMEYLERALAIQEKVHDKDHPFLAVILSNLGLTWRDVGNARKAMEYFERALAIQEKIHDKDHPFLAVILNNLGLAWQDLGNARKAMEYFERALAIQEKVHDKDHPFSAVILSNLGATWKGLDSARQAKECLERALFIQEKAYGKDHPSLALILSNLGATWKDLVDAHKAKECLERALLIQEKAYGKDHPSLALILSNLGVTWNDLGDAYKAKECYEKALLIEEKTYGTDHPNLAMTLSNLGGVWSDLGDAHKAKEYDEKAYQIALLKLGVDHPNTQFFKRNLETAPKAVPLHASQEKSEKKEKSILSKMMGKLFKGRKKEPHN